MKQNGNILTIIPARGGSKGIPGKNVYNLCGKPLIGYVCEAALGAESLQRVIVSTDCQEIAETAARFGVEVPFTRPAQISEDESSTLDAVLHAIETMQKIHNYRTDIVVYLQPTSPLTTSKHIDEAMKLFLSDPQADSLVSAVPIDHSVNPSKLMKLDGDYFVPYQSESKLGSSNRHSITEQLFARNGPAIVIFKSENFVKKKNFYGEKILPYLMKKSESVDIDDYEDLEWAEFLLKKRQK